MKFRRNKSVLAAAILFAAYIGGYLALRVGGPITHYENRGTENRNEVKARESEWNDILPDSYGKIETTVIRAINLVYAPVMTIEEQLHKLRSR